MNDRGSGRRTEHDMGDPGLPTLLALVFAAVAVLQAAYYYPKMPDVMATHFRFAGAADGWSSRVSFAARYGLTEALFLVLAFGIPALIERLPSRWVNIPHREIWLEPPHRERTISELRIWMRWFGALTLGFLVATAQFIYMANLTGEAPQLAASYTAVLIGFVAALLWLVFLMYRRFGRPPAR